MTVRDTRARSVVKGFSWRFIGTIDTTVISYLITGNPLKALSIGGIEVFSKVFLYYVHERIWTRIKWGRKMELSSTENTPSDPSTDSNIHPVFDKLLSREERQQFLRQKSKVVWLTGLSGSGKTTIAQGLERKLLENNFFAQVLDGDNIRNGINCNLGFSMEDRQENIRRISEVAKLYKNSGVVTICTFISPTREIRSFAKNIIGEDDFLEVFINAPLEVCEERDVKGLYKKARAGEIKEFTGIDSPYENPISPDFVLMTGEMSIDEAVNKLTGFLLPQIKLDQ
ncbi:MAG: adenylyl-sulfate kinase [Saprospiraceae bacterium]